MSDFDEILKRNTDQSNVTFCIHERPKFNAWYKGPVQKWAKIASKTKVYVPYIIKIGMFLVPEPHFYAWMQKMDKLVTAWCVNGSIEAYISGTMGQNVRFCNILVSEKRVIAEQKTATKNCM